MVAHRNIRIADCERWDAVYSVAAPIPSQSIIKPRIDAITDETTQQIPKLIRTYKTKTKSAERSQKWQKTAPDSRSEEVMLAGDSELAATSPSGVTTGENSMIGARAVVTKNVLVNVAAVGNPANAACSLSSTV